MRRHAKNTLNLCNPPVTCVSIRLLYETWSDSRESLTFERVYRVTWNVTLDTGYYSEYWNHLQRRAPTTTSKSDLLRRTFHWQLTQYSATITPANSKIRITARSDFGLRVYNYTHQLRIHNFLIRLHSHCSDEVWLSGKQMVSIKSTLSTGNVR